MRVYVRLARNWRILFTPYHGNNKRLRVGCVLHAPITLLFSLSALREGTREERERVMPLCRKWKREERCPPPLLLPPSPTSLFPRASYARWNGEGEKISFSQRIALHASISPPLAKSNFAFLLFMATREKSSVFRAVLRTHGQVFTSAHVCSPFLLPVMYNARPSHMADDDDRPAAQWRGGSLSLHCTLCMGGVGSTVVFWDPLGKKPSTVTGAKMDLCARKAAKQHFPASYPPLSSRIHSKSRGKHTGGRKALKIGGLRICIADEVGKVFALLTPHSEFSLAYIFSTFHFRA